MTEWITPRVREALDSLPVDRRAAVHDYARLAIGATTRLVENVDAANRIKPMDHLRLIMRSLVVIDHTLGEMMQDSPAEPFDPAAQVDGYNRAAAETGNEVMMKIYQQRGGDMKPVLDAQEGIIGMHGNVCAIPSASLTAESPYNGCLYAAQLSYRAGVLMPVATSFRGRS